jgi:hypothetical protein
MSNIVKIGRIDINLDAFGNASRSDVDQMYSTQDEEFRNELWLHLEKLNPSKEEEPIKKKKKKTKEGEE